MNDEIPMVQCGFAGKGPNGLALETSPFESQCLSFINHK